MHLKASHAARAQGSLEGQLAEVQKERNVLGLLKSPQFFEPLHEIDSLVRLWSKESAKWRGQLLA